MFCPNCGKLNEDENKFCKHCGHNLKTHAQATQPLTPSAPPAPQTQAVQTAITGSQRTVYTAPARPVHSNIDLGYLLIAILVLINIFIWMVWNNILSSNSTLTSSDTQAIYKLLRVVTTIISMAQFLVMLIFAKRPVYKILILLIGIFVVIYDLYYLVQSFTKLY